MTSWPDESRLEDASMRVVMLTAGSRGDVQPYVALGKALAATGHRVRVAAFPGFERLITDHHLDFAPITNIHAALMARKEWQRWQRSGHNLARYIYHFFQVVNAAETAVVHMLDEFWHACQDADLIISSASGMGGPEIAARRRVPHCWALLQPMTRTHAFPHFLTPAGLRLPPQLNYATYLIAEIVYLRLFRASLHRWRQSCLSTACPPGPAINATPPGHPSSLTVYGYSPAVVPQAADYGPLTYVAGYWFLDNGPDWQPSAALRAFLEAGPPPVYIDLTHVPTAPPETLLTMAIEALRLSGQRGIIQTAGWQERWTELPEGVLGQGFVPHDWLFPRLGAIVHHGGAGTTANALRAGVCSVGIPRFFDQPFWSRRLYELGVGPPPIRPRQLTARTLARAITRMVTDPAMQVKARQLGRTIAAQDGLQRAVEWLHRHLQLAAPPNPTC